MGRDVDWILDGIAGYFAIPETRPFARMLIRQDCQAFLHNHTEHKDQSTTYSDSSCSFVYSTKSCNCVSLAAWLTMSDVDSNVARVC